MWKSRNVNSRKNCSFDDIKWCYPLMWIFLSMEPSHFLKNGTIYVFGAISIWINWLRNSISWSMKPSQHRSQQCYKWTWISTTQSWHAERSRLRRWGVLPFQLEGAETVMWWCCLCQQEGVWSGLWSAQNWVYSLTAWNSSKNEATWTRIVAQYLVFVQNLGCFWRRSQVKSFNCGLCFPTIWPQ